MKRNKLLAVLLALAMTLSLLPTAAMAIEPESTDEELDSMPKAVEGVITLENNVKLSAPWVVTETVELNLNGHTIYNSTDIWKDSTYAWSLISVQGGNLTINGSGTLHGKENDCYAVDIRNGGQCTINGGTYVGNIDAVYVFEGKLVVNGGEFSIQQKDNNHSYGYVLNCYDDNRINNTATICVTGGKFHEFNPADCWAEGEHTNFVAPDYKVVADDSTYTVVPKDYVAQVNGADKYESLADAIDAAQSGDTVKLLKNTSVGQSTISEENINVIVDLNNKTLTMAGNDSTFITGGAKLTIQNGSIEANGFGITKGVFCVESGSSLTLDRVTANTTGAMLSPRGDAAKVTVSNSSITTSNTYCVTTNASSAENYNVQIVLENSSFAGWSPVLVNVPCSLEMTNCTVNGSMHGVVVRGGTATITGGTITQNYTDTDAEDMANYFNNRAWGTGNMINLGALIVGNKHADSYQYPSNVTVTGTKIQTTGSNAALFPAVYTYANAAADKGVTLNINGTESNVIGSIVAGNADYNTISITGGTFSTDPSAYKAEGTIVRVNDDNTYTVVTNSNLTSGTYLTVPSVASGYRYTGSEGAYVVSKIPSSSGGSSSGSSNTTTTTEKNPDGSTTTTTTNKTTGTVTETTKNTDGSTTTVETKKDGTVTETNKTADGTTGTVVTDKYGDVTEVQSTVSSSAAKEAAKTGEAVTLPVEVPAAASTEDAPAVDVTVPKSAGSVKVEIPVEKVTPGTVAVIVNADGTEEIVSTSVVTENGVALTLDGSATVKIIDNSKDFVDVPETNVFYNEISSLSAREIMIGKTEDTFDLYSSVTLNQIANVAGRITGAVDVKDFNAGIVWGGENGLKTGNVAATRGDVLKALYVAAGSPAVEDTAILARFSDSASISADMAAIVAWAAQNGILKGTVDGKADLGVNVTRGQACALAGRAMGVLA